MYKKLTHWIIMLSLVVLPCLLVAASTGAQEAKVMELQASSKQAHRIVRRHVGDDVADAALPKNIWLLWESGWDTAPYVPQMVASSWKMHNPSWNIILLDKENLHEYMDTSGIKDIMKIQAKSDYVRVTLLATHGGVWADASLLCMQPLDGWVSDKVKATGFWVYHGRDEKPASWFLVSSPSSKLIQNWKKGIDQFWQEQNMPDYKYHWLDDVFGRQQKSDPKFQEEWEKIPYISNHAPCQSALLASEAGAPLSSTVRECLDKSPPYVLKMTLHRKGGHAPLSDSGNAEDTNGHYAIYKSLGTMHISELNGLKSISISSAAAQTLLK